MVRTEEEFAGQRITVMGLGRFGGGVGAVRFLVERGAIVTVTDHAPAVDLEAPLKEIAALPRVTLRLGGHDVRDFREAHLVVVNPAVKPGNPFVQQAHDMGVAVSSEIRLFWQRCPCRIAGVTGSNGKSTTTALLHTMLQADGRRAWLGGNLGGSLLSDLPRIGPDDWVVLELSSFQLADLAQLRVSPAVAVVTNFTPNHLDWHPTLDDYRQAKQVLLRWQSVDDLAVLPADSEVMTWPGAARRVLFDVNSPDAESAGREQALFRHRQNRSNVSAAAAAARAMGVGSEAIRSACRDFRGLPHRLQHVGTIAGRTFYDDSAATTVESTLAALESLEQPIVLLAGGADKGVDLAPLAEAVVRRAKGAVLMGSVAPRLASLVRDCGPHGVSFRRIRVAASFDEAFRSACALAEPGDAVLLSPGCSSFGWFTNFAERGARFVAAVREYEARTAHALRTS
jgi:UDP-N-acetylmuramoylalanine--D-glutamate ligase